ncbi:MAG TPA: hypothetical protein VF483_12030 [Gemmatimonadaceae bacterium]
MTARSTRLAAAAALTVVAACSGTATTGGAGSAPAPKAAAPMPPKPFEYATSTGQYRLSANRKITQSMMGQQQEVNTSDNRLLTIALSRTTPDTITMQLTVDSLTMVGAMGMTPPGVDKVPGTKFTAKIAPNGSFYSVTGPSAAENPLGSQMTDELGRAMPRIRAILAAGTVWTDTVTDVVKQNGLEVNRQVITKFSVMGDSLISGESSWKIARETATKNSGKGNVQGQDVAVESAGTGKGMLLISKKGVLMAGQSEDMSTGSISLAANGMQIGVNSTSTTTFTKVK